MPYNLVASHSNPPLASLVMCSFAKQQSCEQHPAVTVSWGKESSITVNERLTLTDDASICRFLSFLAPANLYGKTILERTEIDHWISFVLLSLSDVDSVTENIHYLDKALGSCTYLVGQELTIADIAVWSALFLKLRMGINPGTNVKRWFSFIESLQVVQKTMTALPGDVKEAFASTTKQSRKEEGKFEELPGAELGKVVVRFPPEASGYLHIGHAKAALLNQHYQQHFKGKLILRFDDTNPAKEKEIFEKVIEEDLKMLEVKPDIVTHTSDYFDLMLQYCEKLLHEGKAYADDSNPEVMKQERDDRTESKNRNNSIHTNFQMWEEMKKGTELGLTCCIRAKIDMSSNNGCLRDPTIYRCKPEPHVRTGLKYKVYPTYDFACPIVDSIEGVTHALRTTEYHDRDDQFYWFIKALELANKPFIWEYSRLNMTNTVLSKRKLTWFVDEGVVDGWDDPRFPTVRGVLRRGMTVEGLKQFIVAQGSSTSVVTMEWDKIWAFNKKVLDPIAPRYTALNKDSLIPVHVDGAIEDKQQVAKHPKNPDVGMKTIWTSSDILIEVEDVPLLKIGENATFINWGNLRITDIKYNNDKRPISVTATVNIEDKDYKKTPKLTWLAVNQNVSNIPCVCVNYEHIITKQVLGKDENFKDFIESNSRNEIAMIGDPELVNVKKSDIIQIQRKGFFICDQEYQPASVYTGRTTPCVLISVPDGKEVGTTSTQQKRTVSKAKKKEKSPVEATESRKSVEKPVTTKSAAGSDMIRQLHEDIKQQGDSVRIAKSNKSPKDVIDKEVKQLLQLKSDFKVAAGIDWKPDLDIIDLVTPTIVQKSGDNSAESIHQKICEQGEKVRNLKSVKASKVEIDAEVKTLITLKADFVAATGIAWKPNIQLPSMKPEGTLNLNEKRRLYEEKLKELELAKETKAKTDAEVKALGAEYRALTGLNWKADVESLNSDIREQGDKIRNLKSAKKPKQEIDDAVQVLLSLKSDFKTASGLDWTPDFKAPATQDVTSSNSTNSAELLDSRIRQQGDKIRNLKSAKGSKQDIDADVKSLLSLKAEFKSTTNLDWKPDIILPKSNVQENVTDCVPAVPSTEVIDTKIRQQGDKVRALKSAKAPKGEVDAAVKELLSLKSAFQTVSGQVWKPDIQISINETNLEQVKETGTQSMKKNDKKSKEENKQNNIETTKLSNLCEWYKEVLFKGEMLEYFEVEDFHIMRPWAYSIWESIQQWLTSELQKLNVEDSYFPVFISKTAIQKNPVQAQAFKSSTLWVTKSGNSDMAEPVAVRPTSEAIIYPAIAKWVQSHRDLPIKVNQWNNVVRWESTSNDFPLLQSKEFLFQEGHSAYEDAMTAKHETHIIMELYEKVYKEFLALPTLMGNRNKKHQFPGSEFTIAADLVVCGRGLQGASAHYLAQNYSKRYEIQFEDPTRQTADKCFAYQMCYGMSTKLIGAAIIAHGDDKGLVLPPKVAYKQVVIIPLTKDVERKCQELELVLNNGGIRTVGDYRIDISSDLKFCYWDIKGVPLRLEMSAEDAKNGICRFVRRDNGVALTTPIDASLPEATTKFLDKMQTDMLQRATDNVQTRTVTVTKWGDFISQLAKGNIVLAPFCGESNCEDTICVSSNACKDLDDCRIITLCIPFDQPEVDISQLACINPSCKLETWAFSYFAKTF